MNRLSDLPFRSLFPLFSSVPNSGMLKSRRCSQRTFTFARLAFPSCRWVSIPSLRSRSPPPSIADSQSAGTGHPKMLPQPDANLLLEAFLSDPGIAVIGFGLDGAIFLWNQAAEALYGFSQAEILGKPVKCLLPPYKLPAHGDLLQHPAYTESPWDGWRNASTGAVCAFQSGSTARRSVTFRVKLSAFWSVRTSWHPVTQAPSREHTCASSWNKFRSFSGPPIPACASRLIGDAPPASREKVPAILSAKPSTNTCAARKMAKRPPSSTFSHSAAFLRALNTRAAIASTI